MATPVFEQQSILVGYQREYAALDEQIRVLTDRRDGLQQIIAGLEKVLQGGGGTVVPDRPDIVRGRNLLANAMAVLRYVKRPLNAAEVQRTLEAGGVAVKRDTVYKAMRRAVDRRWLTQEFDGFGLTEWDRG